MKIAITGAGIAGLTAAAALKKYGLSADVFEASFRIEPVGAGLGLAQNALKALGELGLADKVRKKSSRMQYFEITRRDGSIISSTSVEDFGESLCIHRAALHEILVGAVEPERIFTGKKAVALSTADNGVVLSFADGTTHEADFVIIADGINSRLRDSVAPHARVRYAGYTCWRGVMDAPCIDLGGATEIWDTAGRFGYVPLPDHKIYWFACINAQMGRQLAHFTLSDLQRHFAGFGKRVTEILGHTPPEGLIYDDINDMEPLSKYEYGRVVLIGDAAHAATPNMGQGACMAIEDAVILAKEISESPSVHQALLSFEQKRLERTHFIIKQSRTIGRMAQLQNPLLATLRNIALRLAPKSMQRKQLDKLYSIEF